MDGRAILILLRLFSRQHRELSDRKILKREREIKMERKEDYGAPTLFSNPVSIGILFGLYFPKGPLLGYVILEEIYDASMGLRRYGAGR